MLSFFGSGSYGGNELGGKYAVNGDQFTAMTLNSANIAKVPTTYHWDWD